MDGTMECCGDEVRRGWNLWCGVGGAYGKPN